MTILRRKAALPIVLAGCVLMFPPLYGGGGDSPALSSVDMNHLTVDVVPLSNTTVEIGEDVLFEVTIRNNYEADIQADLWFTVDLTGVDHEKRVSAPYLDRQSPISGVVRGTEEVALRLRARPLDNVDPGAYTFYAKVGYSAIDFIKSVDRFQGIILDRNERDFESGDIRDEWVISSVWAVNEAGHIFLMGPDGSFRKTADIINNFPNPFNPSTNLTYDVKPAGDLRARVTLDIYDIRGRFVRNLVDESQAAGTYTVKWNGKDARGANVNSGIYLFKLQSGRDISFKKGVLTK